MAEEYSLTEIIGLWERIKDYIDLSKITATDKMNQKQQLEEALSNPSKDSKSYPNNLKRLADSDFNVIFVETEEIRTQFLEARIKKLKVRGVTRFQVAKGTQGLRGGTFLKGTDFNTALKDLREKSEG